MPVHPGRGTAVWVRQAIICLAGFIRQHRELSFEIGERRRTVRIAPWSTAERGGDRVPEQRRVFRIKRCRTGVRRPATSRCPVSRPWGRPSRARAGSARYPQRWRSSPARAPLSSGPQPCRRPPRSWLRIPRRRGRRRRPLPAPRGRPAGRSRRLFLLSLSRRHSLSPRKAQSSR